MFEGKERLLRRKNGAKVKKTRHKTWHRVERKCRGRLNGFAPIAFSRALGIIFIFTRVTTLCGEKANETHVEERNNSASARTGYIADRREARDFSISEITEGRRTRAREAPSDSSQRQRPSERLAALSRVRTSDVMLSSPYSRSFSFSFSSERTSARARALSLFHFFLFFFLPCREKRTRGADGEKGLVSPDLCVPCAIRPTSLSIAPFNRAPPARASSLGRRCALISLQTSLFRDSTFKLNHLLKTPLSRYHFYIYVDFFLPVRCDITR